MLPGNIARPYFTVKRLFDQFSVEAARLQLFEFQRIQQISDIANSCSVCNCATSPEV